MKIMVKKCNCPAEVKEVERLELEDMQELVGGLIEHLWCGDGIDMWLNDEGKLLGLPLNVILEQNGDIIDVVAGDVFFTSSNDEGETIGLSDEHISEIEKRFGIIMPISVGNEIALSQVFSI